MYSSTRPHSISSSSVSASAAFKSSREGSDANNASAFVRSANISTSADCDMDCCSS